MFPVPPFDRLVPRFHQAPSSYSGDYSLSGGFLALAAYLIVIGITAGTWAAHGILLAIVAFLVSVSVVLTLVEAIPLGGGIVIGAAYGTFGYFMTIDEFYYHSWKSVAVGCVVSLPFVAAGFREQLRHRD